MRSPAAGIFVPKRTLGRSALTLPWALAALLGVGAPAGADGPAGVRPPAKSAAADPVGDTLGSAPGPIDLTGLTAVRVDRDLLLGLSFAGTISPPDSGRVDAVHGFVDLDADGDGATGDQPFVDFATPHSSGLGTDLYIPFASYRPAERTFDVVAAGGDPVLGRATAHFGARSLAIRLPEALVASAARVAAVVGTALEVTDGAPNGGFVQAAAATAGDAVRLLDDRFAIEIAWQDFEGQAGVGTLATGSADSAIFWFFRPANWELMVKIIDGCANNGHFWVFSAATTNVAYTLSITDIRTGAVRQYANALGVSAPAVTDTLAFATCP